MGKQLDKYTLRRKFALMRAGITTYELARRWGCSQGFVSHLLTGRARSYELEFDLAKLLGMKHSFLFPEHPGQRKRKRRQGGPVGDTAENAVGSASG
jgi:transcriptional regulator with XRE-family HTH domain